MKKNINEINITRPSEQSDLFGYKDYFQLFIELVNKKEIPRCILFTGLRGSGKSTFAYHLINYLLSQNEPNKYSIENKKIDINNRSYKLLNSYTHPNFRLVENYFSEKEIKIDQVRNLLKFLRNTAYDNNFKIVMIDNVENLNLNSGNALLKSLEETSDNTLFFIIHNSALKILDTIKSRCVEFKIFLNKTERENIFNKLAKQYKKNNFNTDKIYENHYFETPGNLLRYLLYLDNNKLNFLGIKLEYILYFIDIYVKEKNPEILSFISLFIEKFYTELCLNNFKDNNIFLNKSKILKLIYNMKKFNLDEKNIFINIKDILISDAK